ncbi:hypothetical protein CHU00_14850 [Sphingobacterium cellulitidis]|uniref:hypothetical protein n=1 Tax=Sphingobacterium cellulitidis TaxID=1768011 RepID=UPI000B9462D9|nr:hypothetical protein [Sphingobacterium cellulitidis]OYD44890.1 hypothetical protein CHU00_14850 [Sphingobacterium cellulitidis]
MDKKTAIESLKETLNVLKGVFSKEASAPEAIQAKVLFKFEIQETEEGSVISYPTLEVGAPVTVASAEGESPASDGWYKVEGNIEINVVDGLIAEVKQPEVEETEEFEDEEKTEDAPAEQSAEVIAVVEQAVQAVEAVQAEIEALKSEFSKFSKIDENVKALTDAVQKFSKEPVASSVTEVKEEVTNSKEDRIKRLAGYKK